MSYFNYFNQYGGASCSLCGSPGTNKSTCPLNPAAARPNPGAHPLANATAATAATPALAASTVTTVKPTFVRMVKPMPIPRPASPKATSPRATSTVKPVSPKAKPASPQKPANPAAEMDRDLIKTRLDAIRNALIEEQGTYSPGEWVYGDDVYDALLNTKNLGTTVFVVRFPYNELEGPVYITEEMIDESRSELPWLVWSPRLASYLNDVAGRIEARNWLAKKKLEMKLASKR